jgi:hypothetical protein
VVGMSSVSPPSRSYTNAIRRGRNISVTSRLGGRKMAWNTLRPIAVLNCSAWQRGTAQHFATVWWGTGVRQEGVTTGTAVAVWQGAIFRDVGSVDPVLIHAETGVSVPYIYLLGPHELGTRLGLLRFLCLLAALLRPHLPTWGTP